MNFVRINVNINKLLSKPARRPKSEEGGNRPLEKATASDLRTPAPCLGVDPDVLKMHSTCISYRSLLDESRPMNVHDLTPKDSHYS